MNHNIFSDTKMTRLGLGTSRIASLGDALSYSDAHALINAAFDNGIRVIDTSDTYGSGDSERLIARVISGKRNEFFIITKAGFPYMSLPGVLSPLNQIGKKIFQKLKREKNFSAKYLIRSLESSLKRLKTDAVDAFLLHEPFYKEIADGECWEALEKIKASGKAKFTGVSTNDVKVLEAGLVSKTIEVVQTSITYRPGNKSEVLSFCNREDIPVIGNQVLSSLGYLKSNDKFRQVLYQFGKNETDIVDILLGYALFHQNINCVLVGTKNISHLISNARVLKSEKNDAFVSIFNALEKL